MDSRNVLVTGGAGYVGSHVCLKLAEAGFTPVTFDDLSGGSREFVQWGPLEIGDIRDAAALARAFAEHRPVGVIHFAARIEVSESVRDPLAFYDTNVAGTLKLLQAATAAGVEAFVFSSTCAVYGEPLRTPIDEEHPCQPISPYGHGKRMVEQILADVGQASGLRWTALRYFNAAGADPEGRIGERHDPETHVIPLALKAAMGGNQPFKVFGTDYPTRDGTAVRDYIHVLDLADAHVLALRRLLDGGTSRIFNLGTGTGTTVRELVEAIGTTMGRPFAAETAERRPGDPPVLLADNRRAREELGWRPRWDLGGILDTAARWHRKDGA